MPITPPGPQTIVRQTLHQELVTRIREMIIEGELLPGDKIAELALSKRFGVSRTPLREALRALAAEGLVSLLPQRGAIVSVVTRAEIDELFPIIGALEALAAETVCRIADTSQLQRLRTIHEQLMGHFRTNQEAAYRRANRLFHETMFEIAGNTALADLYQSLLIRIHSSRFIVTKAPADWQRAADEHERIIAALEARNCVAASALLKAHLSETAARSTHNFIERSELS